MRIPLFRIWYSTTYTTLLIITILLLAISPTDTIYQSFKANELQKVFVIGGVYLLTCLIVLLIYSTRIYTNRTVLAAIPKGYVPIEEGEVGKAVRKMIVKHLKRSAVIAWDSRPRDVRGELDALDEEKGEESRPNTAESKKDKEKAHKKKGHHHAPDATIIPVSAHRGAMSRILAGRPLRRPICPTCSTGTSYANSPTSSKRKPSPSPRLTPQSKKAPRNSPTMHLLYQTRKSSRSSNARAQWASANTSPASQNSGYSTLPPSAPRSSLNTNTRASPPRA
jgi:hypothetical protein